MRLRYQGLDFMPFRPLTSLSDEELSAHGMCRMIADEKPGFPCRVTLEDAEPGETVLLLPYEHHSADTPYRASGPIFVREAASQTFDGDGRMPPVLATRDLSLRAYTADGMMVDADITKGADAKPVLERLFAKSEVKYVHVHFARRGCYACRVTRVA